MRTGGMYEFRNMLNERKILMCFTGLFSQGIIEELGAAIKKYMETGQNQKNKVHSVFSIFIEQTQNIKNYSEKKRMSAVNDEILTSGIIIIGKNEENYFVSSGNLIENNDVPKLIEKLEKVKNLDKEQLKALYKEVLKKGELIENQGAGLGLIEMARKATSPIEYSFVEKDENCSFFILDVIV